MKTRGRLIIILLLGALILPACAKRIKIQIPESREEERILFSKAFEDGDKNHNLAKQKFANPLDGKLSFSSPFGAKRARNHVHKGVDLKAKIDTKVKAINDGRVVLVARLFREGIIVIVDHGFNVFSLYMHMSTPSVKKGEMVKRGKVIGLSGNTGEGVTGPHLHFAIYLNGDYVDPVLFMTVANLYQK